MNTFKTFKIRTCAVGYKSVEELTVNVTYHIKTVKREFLADLFGENMDTVAFTQFELEPSVKSQIETEFPQAIDHLMGLVRELILFGAPYNGYKIVREAA